jgi:hypothetical protein
MESKTIYAASQKKLVEFLHDAIARREYIVHPTILVSKYLAEVLRGFEYKPSNILLPFNYIRDEGQCVICMENNPNDHLISLKCCPVDHCHHINCLTRWSATLNDRTDNELFHCAVCKRNVNLI